jgi:hypothetical protein
MDKNILYFFIIIICIIIFYLYFNYNKESFVPWDLNHEENKPEFVKKYELMDDNTDPNYRYEDITQYNFNKLFSYLKKINNENIVLKNKGNYNFYTQSTTEDKLRMNLDMITKYVILLLNKTDYYDFNKTNYGDVEVWVDKDGNEEIKYELFLWDKKNYFEIKLKVDIIKFVEKENIDSYGIKEKKYIFTDFNIGYPFKDQIIPLPTEVIISANIDTGLSTVKPNIPSKIKYLYLNQIEVQNSTLIVDYQKDKYPFNKLEVNEHGFSGVTDMSLEYINIKNDNNPYFEKGRLYNKWPILDEEPKWKGQYPSKDPPKQWDVDGIYYYGKDDKRPFTDPKLCDIYQPGIRWSPDKEPLQPYYWPTLATLPRNCGEYYNLFDLSNGTNGTFFGGGKK